MLYLIFSSVLCNASQLMGITESKAVFQLKCKFEFLCNKVVYIGKYLMLAYFLEKGID